MKTRIWEISGSHPSIRQLHVLFHLTTVSGQTTSFYYDPDGNLLSKVKPDGSATLYLGGLYEVDLTSVGVTTKKTTYYPGGAMRVDIVGGSNTLYYSLRDHLGSASVLLDSTGNLVANGEQRYYPFGESRLTSADLKTDHLFTGQLSVGLGGIYHYGARMYSPKLGRFLSADTVVPDWTNPQSLNRFSYVYNNPLKYVDPTGHYTECYGTGAFISESTGDGGISWAQCWSYQAASIIGNATWDLDFADAVSAEDRRRAEEAVIHFVLDPSYFADLYTRADEWIGSEEVALLDIFAQYSTLHTTAENLVWLSIAQTFGMEAADSVDRARMQNLVSAVAEGSEAQSSATTVIAAAVAVQLPLFPEIDPKTYHYSQPPGPGWVWKGPPGKGSWYNPTTRESLRVDLNLTSSHFKKGGEIHFDWTISDKTRWRIYVPSGRLERK